MRELAPPPTPAPSDRPVDNDCDLTPVVGANLRRLRVKRGLSLERLARASGVSRAMLGQIELGQSTPTVNLLWKISRALDVPLSTLVTSARLASVMRAKNAKVLTSSDGRFRSRALSPVSAPRSVEFYELRIAAYGVEETDGHAPGTVETLAVASGAVHIRVGKTRHELSLGDSIVFDADMPHAYENPAKEEALLFLVLVHTDRLG